MSKIIKYSCRIKVGFRWGVQAKITKHKVERESDNYIWINGRREGKNTQYRTFFDSFEKAKNALIKKQSDYIRILENRLMDAKNELIKIKKMEEK